MSELAPDFERRRAMTSLAATLLSPVLSETRAAESFQVFDALLLNNKPDLRRYGLKLLPAVADLWQPNQPRDVVDPPGLRKALTRVRPWIPLVFFDIEYWPLYPAADAVREASIDKFITVAQIARRELPSLKFGFYGALPIAAYWTIHLQHQAQYAQTYKDWRATNKALQRLADVVDVIFPSLYTFYTDEPGWLLYADEVLKEARQYGKPIYPFLWFEFHDSTERHDQEIPADYWAKQLRFCREHADGVVLWGGYGRTWNANAAWWRATLETLDLK